MSFNILQRSPEFPLAERGREPKALIGYETKESPSDHFKGRAMGVE